MGIFKKIALFSACLVFVFCLSTRVSRAQTISSVSGNMSEGQTITVNGSGFGNTGPNVVIFDDFEKGTNGARIQTGAGSAQIGTWNSTEGNVIYSNSASVSGGLAFRADMTNGWRNLAETLLPNGGDTDIFVSWWLYLPAADNYPGQGTTDGTNWKQMWIQGSGTADDDLVFPTFDGSAYFFGNDTCLNSEVRRFGGWNFNKGQWHRYWGYAKGLASNGQINLYELDPELGYSELASFSNTQIQCQTGDKFERVHINGYGRQTTNSHPTYDDVYIASGPNARARIEIGNRSSYEDCTNLAVAVPTSWSSSSITARFFKGSFTSGQTTYLFVVDANGNVSNGYPITIGSGGTTPTCSNCCSSTQTCSTAFTTVGTFTRCCATACQTASTDTTLPIVSAFSVTPTTLTVGASLTASYTVTDNTALARAELWRAPSGINCTDTVKTGCVWTQITSTNITGTSRTGTFTSAPTAAGTFYYGLHAVDAAGNVGYESTAVRVTVNAATQTCTNCCSSTQTCPTAFTTVGTCTRCCATACQNAPSTGQTLLTESFNDANFSFRGWVDAVFSTP